MDQTEGGWMLEQVGESFIASTGKWLFRGNMGIDSDASLTKVALKGKPVRSIAESSDVLFTVGDEKVIEARSKNTLEVTHTSDAFGKKLGKVYLLNPKDTTKILVADKTGDVFILSFGDEGFSKPEFFVGHTASMITGLTSCLSNKIVVTTDKDEHIRFTRYPTTSIIEGYAFGHTGFVSALQKVSENVIATGGGDGLLKIWEVPTGKCLFTDSYSATCTINDLSFDCSTSTLFAAVEGVGTVSYKLDPSNLQNIVVTKTGVIASRVASQIISCGGVLVAAYIGSGQPFIEKFCTKPLSGTQQSQVSLKPIAVGLGADIVEVKPSYWQVCTC